MLKYDRNSYKISIIHFLKGSLYRFFHNKQLKITLTIQNFKDVTLYPNLRNLLVATFILRVATCGDWRQGWTTLT